MNSSSDTIEMPKRTFTAEFYVGLFTIIGCLALAYLSIDLAGFSFGGMGSYEIKAEFDNVSGLEPGAAVEIAGVPIGEVSKIYLKDPVAVVVMRIRNDVRIRDDDIFSIRTKGIIGDKYVKISRGASDEYIEPGGVVTETESVVDIEDIIGKIIHNLGNDQD